MTTPNDMPSPAEIERIRKSRNRVMGLLLTAFVVLVFAISIVKIAKIGQ